MSSTPRTPGARRHPLVLALGLLGVGFSARAALPMAALERDPDRTLGPAACSECHAEEFEVWRASAHEAKSKTLTRDPEARRLASALGVRRMMNEERCARCHFTLQKADERLKSVAGVSCESCHGPARDWLELHDDFGSPEATSTTESDEHRARRATRCDEQGMVRPLATHLMARSCFACHTVDDEELVAAGHPNGAGFELLAWSQGEMRHNFVRGEHGVNVVAEMPHRRVLFVIGQMLELEHAVLALGGASGPGHYAAGMAARARQALETLEAIAAAVEVMEVEVVLAAARERELEPGVDPAAIARSVDDCAQKLRGREHELDLAAIDGLLPDADAWVGRPAR